MSMITAPGFRPVPRALAITLLLASPCSACAAEPKWSVESLLTPETVGFLHVRIADVWDNPGWAFYRKMLASLDGAEIKAFDGKFVPNPTQYDSLTVIMPSLNIRMAIPDGRPVGESLLWVIAVKQPIDRAELIKALGPEARIKAHRGVEYLFDEAHWAGIVQVNATTLAAGSEDTIVRMIEQRESAQGAAAPLAKIFTQEAPRHAALLAVNPTTLATPEVLKQLRPEFTPLLKASSAWAALDTKQETRLTLHGEFPNLETAAAGKKAVEAVRKLTLDLLGEGMKEMQADELRATKRPLMGLLDMPAHFAPIVGRAALKYLEAAAKGLAVEAQDTALLASVNLSEFFPANGDVLAFMAFAAFSESYGSHYYSNYRRDDREEIPYYLRDQFERVSAALQAYHLDKGSFPPVALYDKAGKPLVSWRVLILPYLEQRPGEGKFGAPQPAFKGGPQAGPPAVKRTYEDLYKEFKLDEPWDSLNNKKLLERMPSPYRVDFTAQSWRTRTDWKTGMQVFAGPGTLFPGREPVSKGQVPDGIESTIAVVFRDDVANAVPWTKPADIPFVANRQLPKLIGAPLDTRGGNPPPVSDIFAIMADGQSRRFPSDFNEKDFKALVTISGGETVKLPEPRTGPNFKAPDKK
jgi:hypothetical protein